MYCGYHLDDSLCQIDVATGEVSIIGDDLLLRWTPGLAFDRGGDFFGLNIGTNQLVSIDPDTAAAEVIGDVDIDVKHAGLAIDFETDELFAVMGQRDGIPDKLLKLDKETGEASVIGPLGVNWDTVGVEFHPVTGELFTVREFNVLMSLDVDTGEATEIGELSGVSTNNMAALWLHPIEVELNVKPCSNLNAIYLADKTVIPVGIKHTDEFDPTDPDSGVDVSTLRFGAPDVVEGGGGARPVHDGHVEDVVPCEGDGRDDLVVHFPTEDTGFDGDEDTGQLEGETMDGTPLFGDDSVTIVGRR